MGPLSISSESKIQSTHPQPVVSRTNRLELNRVLLSNICLNLTEQDVRQLSAASTALYGFVHSPYCQISMASIAMVRGPHVLAKRIRKAVALRPLRMHLSHLDSTKKPGVFRVRQRTLQKTRCAPGFIPKETSTTALHVWRLRVFDICFSYIPTNITFEILKNCSHLQCLIMHGVKESSRALLPFVAEHAPHLEHVMLSYNVEGPTFIEAFLKACGPRLKTLVLTDLGYHHHPNSVRLTMGEVPIWIASYCKNLNVLALGSHPIYGDSIWQYIFNACTQLHHVHSAIVHRTKNHLAALLRRCPNLTMTLDYYSNYVIPEEMRTIIEHPRIQINKSTLYLRHYILNSNKIPSPFNSTTQSLLHSRDNPQIKR